MAGRGRDGLKWTGRHGARTDVVARVSRRPVRSSTQVGQSVGALPAGAGNEAAAAGPEGSRATLELRLLGEPVLLRDGRPCALPSSRKTRALLAYLAATGKAQRRDQLCTMFWGVPDDPKAALRWSLSKLRSLVDEPDRPRLIAKGDHVALDLKDLAVDVHELRRCVARGPEAAEVAAGDLAWRPFCEGLDLPRCEDFQAWCAAERENVRQLQIRLLRDLADRAPPVEAVEALRCLVAIDPLDEAARVALVEALRLAGRAGEAEEQRHLAVAALDEAGIGIPPGLGRAVDRRPISSPAPIVQHVQFCTARDGTRIAYAYAGSGPPLVKTANWLNHIEYEWESPIWRHWPRELVREHRLLRYDERGNGLSDWDSENISFEAFVDDLETVVDAVGLDRFDLLGISQGCAVSIAYAARHPERVRRMVLVGGYPTGWAIRGDAEEVARREAMLTLTRNGWGQDNPAFRQVFTTLFYPGATPEQADWFNQLQRVSASPEGAQRLQRAMSEIDVRPLLEQVSVPTLVMHSRGDAVVPFSAGRDMAARIPDAQFVALDSANHLVLESEPAWRTLRAQLRDFLR
jgi:pimeloyl-ACP methyl ester carboxylesterase/DNA-binding SARP family transcriptional activator